MPKIQTFTMEMKLLNHLVNDRMHPRRQLFFPHICMEQQGCDILCCSLMSLNIFLEESESESHHSIGLGCFEGITVSEKSQLLALVLLHYITCRCSY